MDSAKDYEAIHKFLPDPNKITTAEDFEKTIIFTNAVNLTQVLCRDLRKRYGRQWHHYIDFLHANRTAKAKRRVMKQFRKGKIKILIATEAAGMVSRSIVQPSSELMQCPVQGADIPDIKLIIQFGIPSSLSVWNQRAGRAGRAANIHAHAILLVEKSMFKRKKKVKLGGKTCTKKPDESSSDESSCESDSSLGSGSEFEGIA
jgi:bloom syndrome protein